MKKTILGVFLGLLVVHIQLFAQSKPFIGYDKVAWGASVADVITAYNLPSTDGISTSGYTSRDDSNIIWVVQENVSNSIKKRTFYFNKSSGSSQLYRIEVSYNKGITISALQTTLTNIYGNPTGTDTDTFTTNVLSITVMNKISYIFFNKFSPDIAVSIVHTVTEGMTSNMFDKALTSGEELEIIYLWKKFQDEYENSKVEL
jgi:hypothetical protein